MGAPGVKGYDLAEFVSLTRVVFSKHRLHGSYGRGGGAWCQRVRSCGNRILNSCCLFLNIDFINPMVGGGGARCQRIRSCGNRILNSCCHFLNIDFINPMVGGGGARAKGYDLAEIVSLTRVVIF